MAYMIWRTAKLKSRSQISASSSHMMRTRPTPNAAPEVSNKILQGSAAPAKDVFDKLDSLEKIRKNAVLAIEFLASGSPEWWEHATAEAKNEWVRRVKDQINKEFGVDNVVHMQLHLDEKTPHLTGLVVPLDGGKLKASKWMDGPKLLAAQQTRMAEVVADLGLKRGVKGSKAQHQRVKRFYGTITKTAELADPIPDLRRIDVISPQAINTHNARIKAFNDALKENHDLHINKEMQAREIARKDANILASEERAEQLEAKLSKTEAQKRVFEEAQKKQAEQLRSTPLDLVAQKLGLERDRDHNWKDEARTVAISITGRKFYDHKAQKGSGGAFDLVMYYLQCDFQTAKAWMLSNIGADALIAESVSAIYRQAKKEAKELQKSVQNGTQATYVPPAPVEANWSAVKRYLTKARELSEEIIERMHERGEIYADRFRNAVFKGPAGAILRGTNDLNPFKGHAKGSNRSIAWRGIVGSKENFDQLLVISENPIDAISYIQGNHLEGTAASTGGVTATMPENLRNAAWRRIIVAFDNDANGKSFGEKLVKDIKSRGFKNVESRYPRHLKDWNAHLVSFVERQRKNDRQTPSEGPEGP